MGQGKENVKNYLKENPQIKEEIDRKLREKLGIFDGDVDENENEDDSPKTLFDE
ncbi:recombinase A [Mycobacteroides abscessus subsp. massiliense]|nr:recombinase A [Mycobacteroides abscessus subsp. massiliense]